jgi:predicted HicB family RNase H-like nuclease
MIDYKGYIAHIEFDGEAGIFHGEVINTRDVITFQGKSVEELRREFEESVEDYLEFCAERNEEPEKPFSGYFTVRLSPEQHRRVVFAAEKMGERTENWVVKVLDNASGLCVQQ